LTNCNRRCVDLTSDSTNCGLCGNTCNSGSVCTAGVCACPMGFLACNGICTDVSKDPLNCGGCGMVCGKGQVCSNGACK
jgi:Stigma-specific protein, Stig1